MENGTNSLIMGRIPTNGGGISKTYQDSIIRYIHNEDSYIVKDALRNDSGREKLFLDKNTNCIVLESKLEAEGNYKELEILQVLPYGDINEYGTRYFDYFVEVIEKELLHRHLLDERSIVEDLRYAGNAYSLKRNEYREN